MALAVVDAYGAPSYGPLRSVQGIVAHTPENADPSLAAAIAIAKWQATASNTSGGSYHGILGHNGTEAISSCVTPAHWSMVRSVPWNQAAGGISTVRTNPPWSPGRYPWIQQLLTADAYSDPNAHLQQIALSGKAAWYVANGYPKGLLIRLAEWVITLEASYSYDAVLMMHRHWQTDRTDPGPLDLWDKVLVEYARLKAGSVPTVPLVDRKNAAFDQAGRDVTALVAAFTAGVSDLRATLQAGRNES